MRLIAALAVCCIASIAYAQDNPKASQKLAAKAQRGTEQNPLAVKVLPSQNAEAESRKRDDEANKRDDYWRHRVEGEHRIGTATWAVFWATVALAAFTATLWAATLGLFRESKNSAKRQLRAYIGVHDVFYPWNQNENDPMNRRKILLPPKLWIRVKNAGQTPGFDMRIRVGLARRRVDADFNFADREIDRGPQMLEQDRWVGAKIPMRGTEYDPLKECGSVPFTVYGRIIYSDIYQRWWVTRFCYIYRSDYENRFDPYEDRNREEGYYSSYENALHDRHQIREDSYWGNLFDALFWSR